MPVSDEPIVIERTALPLVSVIVPCLGHAEELRGCLAALAAQNTPRSYEVIVVDSAMDDRVAAVASSCPLAKLVRSGARLNAGAARNHGVAIAMGEVLVFTDADCRPEPGFLQAACATLEQGAKLVTGPILDATDGFIAACDNLLQFVDFSAGRPLGKAQYAPGCNLAMRKADFLAVGAFPESRAEDSLLSVTVARHWPGELVFDPEMRVKHRGRPTLSALIAHHRSFGVDRGQHHVHLERWQVRLGRAPFMKGPIALKRLAYIVSRTLRWNPQRLAFVLFSTPVLMMGLLAWASGFRAGLHLAGRSAETQHD